MAEPNFQVVPSMLGHAKFRRLGNERFTALGVWTACGMWCVANSSDGFIPREIVEGLATSTCNTLQVAGLLVAAGLWVEKEMGGEEGYCFHDWDDVNVTRADTAKRRNATRRRVAEHRARKRAAREAAEGQPGNALQGSYGNALHERSTPVTASPPPSPPHTPSLPTPPTGGAPGSSNQTLDLGSETLPPQRRGGGASRGTRIPEDWQPTAADIDWFRQNCPHLEGRGRELTDEFRDYWIARTGKDATKNDWSRTWKNRMRDREERERNRQQDRATRTGGGGVGSPARSTTDERIAALDRFKSQPEQPQLGDNE